MLHTKEKWAEANDGMMAIFAELAACRASGASADSDEAQALARHAASSAKIAIMPSFASAHFSFV